MVSEPVKLSRIWRMRELQVCFQSGAHVDFSCMSGALACTCPFADGSWEFGRFDPEIARKLLKVDIRGCDTLHNDDKRDIIAWFEEAKGGIQHFQERLVRVAAGPVLRDAARLADTDHVSEIRWICATRGIVVNGGALKGSLGNSAVHVAAAAGNIEALRTLLDTLSDPNAEDHIRETPLHYAAFTGHERCAQMLLKYRANPLAESSFGETPCEVAEANAASFLGTRTEAVYKVLSAPARLETATAPGRRRWWSFFRRNKRVMPFSDDKARAMLAV
mmetsp:Transcript_135689/g.302029  ORF Transcript_135689/g.302029 Transcript_135689/m.302029 type:complete len:276 (-) Transcript_135689:49-876(-)